MNSSFQLSLELSKVFPIGKGVEAVTSQILGFARDLRKSGSDIVVEADLNDVFGRGHIVPETEDKFKSVVKIQKFTELHSRSEVRLDAGPGPTVLHALRDRRQLATVIQLSFLGWTQNCQALTAALAGALTKRYTWGVPGASASPGLQGIEGTLTACTSQTSDFAWSYYVNLVSTELKACIPEYYHRDEFLSLIPELLLGALDYLYLVQQLPEDRLITVSNPIGAITLTVWAHHVLGLNVCILVDGEASVVFGSLKPPQLLISWTELGHLVRGLPSRELDEPRIRLLDRDMSIVLEVPSEPDRWTLISPEDRHPLSHYGSIYLYRVFNTDMITRASDPIFKETICLATAAAIQTAQGIIRVLDDEYQIEHNEVEELERVRTRVIIEIWRVLAASRMIFSKHSELFDDKVIDSYVNFLTENPLILIGACLPNGCTAALKKAQIRAAANDQVNAYVRHVHNLAGLVLTFACVDRIEDCAQLPLLILMHSGPQCYNVQRSNESLARGETGISSIEVNDVFKGVWDYMSKKSPSLDNRCFLLSHFGWSVFLKTVGDGDPGDIQLGLVCVRKGVPTNSKTSERKFRLLDNGEQTSWSPYPAGASKLLRGREYIPRVAAEVIERREYWTTTATEFSLSVNYTVKPLLEWRQQIKSQQELITDAFSYRDMHNLLWLTFPTTDCHHSQRTQLKPVKLGPDAAVILGWKNDFEHSTNGYELLPERILIFLTRGDAAVRWFAVRQAVTDSKNTRLHARRHVMLRRENCCETCALEQAAAIPLRWILIL